MSIYIDNQDLKLFVFAILLLGVNLKKTTSYNSDCCTKNRESKTWARGLVLKATNIGLLHLGDGSRYGRHVGNWAVF